MKDDATSTDANTAEPRVAHQPLLIGITGPIGCGKSTVAGMLGEVGGTVIDADDLARKATDKGASALVDIRARFGDSVFQPAGELDRAAMAAVVFADANALADLERIVHPQVRVLVEAALRDASEEEAPFVAIEAIKLIEGRLADTCDEVWLVECDPQTQRERLINRGDSQADAEQRIRVQGTDLVDRLAAELSTHATPVRVRYLSTKGSLDDVRDRVENALADAFDRSGGLPSS